MKVIQGLPSSNHEWKYNYVFVCGDNLDEDFIKVCRYWGTPSSSDVCVSFCSCSSLSLLLKSFVGSLVIFFFFFFF
jgi:hypothetical protein